MRKNYANCQLRNDLCHFNSWPEEFSYTHSCVNFKCHSKEFRWEISQYYEFQLCRKNLWSALEGIEKYLPFLGLNLLYAIAIGNKKILHFIAKLLEGKFH